MVEKKKLNDKLNGVHIMKKLIYLLIPLLCLGVAAGQEVTKAGTTSASFLSIDVGARAVGMGSAYTTLVNDATSMYWNPAGIAGIEKTEALFSYANWIADIKYNFAGVVLPTDRFGNVGINAVFMTMDDMERTTIDDPDGNGETFGAGSFAVGLSYAKELTDRFSIGGNVKYISERIDHSKANGVAIDVGTLFRTQFNGLVIGMNISNYGTKMQMSGRDMLTQNDVDPRYNGNNDNINGALLTDQYELPLIFRVGLSMDVLKGAGNSNLLVAVDAVHPNNDVEYLNVGAEYSFNDLLLLRTGYKNMFMDSSEEGLSFGGGLRFSMGATELLLDYAYHDFGILNDVQMFTFSFRN